MQHVNIEIQDTFLLKASVGNTAFTSVMGV